MRRLAYSETKMVAVNGMGQRIGEDHPRAKLSDEDIDLIRELREPSDGARPLSFGAIATKFEISKGAVHDIVSCRRRAVTPDGYRRVPKAPHEIARAIKDEGFGGF